MARGKKVATKPTTRLDRSEKIRGRCLELTNELINEGFGSLLPPPGEVELIESPDKDPKTNGFIGKVKEPLGIYLQRVSVVGNYSQRPPFEHANDTIYRRLIRDFIEGALIPESKIAALGIGGNRLVLNLDEQNIQFSIIDGLQRLYCLCLAVLLVLRREQLVRDGIITQETWNYFSECVNNTGDPKKATEALLARSIRYEIFWNIDLAGLLHYMVTFNTGQRKMSLTVQLEIMQSPLIQELEQKAKVPIHRDIMKQPGMTRQKDHFAASDLVLATRAFITNNANVTAGTEAENLLEDEAFLENFGDIENTIKTIKRIATELHPELMKVYANDAENRYILSNTTTFLLGLVAACGYIHNRNNMKMLDGAIDKLLTELHRQVEDPLNLHEYRESLQKITSSRGKATRRLVDDTFRRFFMGATSRLEWLDTARQITSSLH